MYGERLEEKRIALKLAKIILPLYREVYGEYHIKISTHMVQIASLIFQTKESDVFELTDEEMHFYEQTRINLAITHGIYHEEYKELEKMFTSIESKIELYEA